MTRPCMFRRAGQVVRLRQSDGTDILITVLKTQSNRVRLMVEAPREVKVTHDNHDRK